MSASSPEAIASIPFAELAAAVAGEVHRPGSPDYERLTTPWNVSVPCRPAAVVAVASDADVAAAVRFAAAHGLEVGVRATGHGAADHLQDTLLVHTGGLDGLRIHPEGWARVGAGVTWRRVLAESAPYGLAGLAGSAPDVGVVGYLTGGGTGPVARTFGVASDHVRALEVVTGDGELRRATPTQNPALFWGLRGGKGTLGIVTAIEFDLMPLAQIYGGGVYFDAADAPRLLRSWATWCQDLPEPATTSIALLRLPELPTVPPPLAGRTTLALRFAWTGATDEGERLIAPMLTSATPVFGGMGVLPYSELGMIHSDPVDPMPVHEEASLLHSLPPDAVDALLGVAGPQAACPQVIVELRQLGGAIGREPAHASAFCHRDTAFTLLSIGVAAGPAVPDMITHAVALHESMARWSTGHSMPNFAPREDAEKAARTYTPEALGRLGTLAATYDPHGVIRAAGPVRAACLQTPARSS